MQSILINYKFDINIEDVFWEKIRSENSIGYISK